MSKFGGKVNLTERWRTKKQVNVRALTAHLRHGGKKRVNTLHCNLVNDSSAMTNQTQGESRRQILCAQNAPRKQQRFSHLRPLTPLQIRFQKKGVYFFR